MKKQPQKDGDRARETIKRELKGKPRQGKGETDDKAEQTIKRTTKGPIS